MIRVERVDITGHAQAVDYLARLKSDIENNRDEALQKAVHNVAGVFRENFEAEGGLHKRWKPLAPQTVEDRIRQGYGGSGPILRRSGALMATAIEFFERSSGGSDSGDGISAHLAVNGEQAELHISGRKAANQVGHQGRPPARPFWFTNDKVRHGARMGVEDWLREIARS